MILARGRRRALGRLRHAHPDGPRLRRRPQPRRGRPLRGGHRQRRRHGDPVRRHPARRRHHLDDDLRPGGSGVLHVPRRRRAAGRRPRRPQRHAADRHLQGVHRAEGVAVRAGAAPAPHRRPHGVLRREHPRLQAALGLRATTSARPARRPRRSWPSRWPTGSATSSWACSRGMDVDVFAPGLSFFFDAHVDFFEEIAKFRAARRIWARWLRDVYGAQTDKAQWLRFHTQTAGVSLTAQQPYNNVGPHGGRGARRGPRRDQLPAHQRARRDAGAAHRAGGRDRPAHPAGAHGRDRRRPTSPTRWAGPGTSRRSPTRSRRRRRRSSRRSG